MLVHHVFFTLFNWRKKSKNVHTNWYCFRLPVQETLQSCVSFCMPGLATLQAQGMQIRSLPPSSRWSCWEVPEEIVVKQDKRELWNWTWRSEQLGQQFLSTQRRTSFRWRDWQAFHSSNKEKIQIPTCWCKMLHVLRLHKDLFDYHPACMLAKLLEGSRGDFDETR